MILDGRFWALASGPVLFQNHFYWAGGTPSLLSRRFLSTVIRWHFVSGSPFSPSIEITLEANPGTTEQQRFIGYREAGINRLSLGGAEFPPPLN
ncbi:hypothetical protein DK37_10065 [Halomonas sp. SUBG004]|nr:hypothetical protein DK37_10065 [Halomonas sp. SUBG004]